MLTLQKTFKYEGDFSSSPVMKVDLIVKFPVFDYKNSDLNEVAVLRQIISTETYSITQNLNENAFHIDIPTENIIGKNNETIKNFVSYTTQSFSR